MNNTCTSQNQPHFQSLSPMHKTLEESEDYQDYNCNDFILYTECLKYGRLTTAFEAVPMSREQLRILNDFTGHSIFSSILICPIWEQLLLKAV